MTASEKQSLMWLLEEGRRKSGRRRWWGTRALHPRPVVVVLVEWGKASWAPSTARLLPFNLGRRREGKKGERRNHMTEKKATRLYIPRTAHSRPGKDLWSARV